MLSALRTVRLALARVLPADRATALRFRVAAAFWPRAEAAARSDGVRDDVVGAELVRADVGVELVRADAVAGLRVRLAGLRVDADAGLRVEADAGLVAPVEALVVVGLSAPELLVVAIEGLASISADDFSLGSLE
ncbi:MAG: hypothetical protein M3022_07730 [Actinomycetota bacterium]|nr:hypothetical protein [Actinomycetota bacterium]